MTNIRNRNHVYNIGDIVSGKLKVLEKIRIQGSHNVKGYIYECLTCGNTDKIRENDLLSNKGCNVCSSNKVLQGYNDLCTTHPEIARLLKDKTVGFEITAFSHRKEEFVCENCNHVSKVLVSNVTKRGFKCTRCSDGISYPEKFMSGVLEQLNVYYERQKMFEWSDNKPYDFFIPSKECIIEVHGIQHYSESFINLDSQRGLEYEQDNDQIKESLAINNLIKNYIIIDCSKSELNFIVKSINESNLANIFDLTNINWLECHKYACSSLVKPVCDLWNEGIMSTTMIGEKMKLGQQTIIKYLKQGNLLGWCIYDSKKVHKDTLKKNHKKLKKKINQLSTKNEVVNEWDSIREASKQLNIDETGISACCNGRKKTAGGFKWMFKEEFNDNNIR